MSVHAGQRPESLGWNLMLVETAFGDGPNYATDNTSSAPSSWSRILYQLQIGEYAVWCEIDDFTSSTIGRIGIPPTSSGWAYESDVTNMNVYYNKKAESFPSTTTANITTKLNRSGKINFWPSNYSRTGGNDSLYDHDDSGFSGSQGYGSFQIHDTTPSTPECVFAWNHWGAGLSDTDWGMGNRNTNDPDWTFANNESSTIYGKRLRIWVK